MSCSKHQYAEQQYGQCVSCFWEEEDRVEAKVWEGTPYADTDDSTNNNTVKEATCKTSTTP